MMENGMMGGGMMDIEPPMVEEQKALLAYLQRNALRPASVETLGPPDTGLHTADEWPGVVERMQKNMEIMGKPVITNQERDEIAGYLISQAR